MFSFGLINDTSYESDRIWAEVLRMLNEMAPRKGRKSRYTPHQGKQECERRQRQIERGQLRAENGLLLTGW